MRSRQQVFHVNNDRLIKMAGNLTNSFVYYNGKLVVENRPHPQIVREHFPDAYLDDLQAGLIFEENGQIYPVFHSYTLTSQERKREALAALEKYYHRPIGEELDYDEAMNRLDKEARTANVQFVEHEVENPWGMNGRGTWAIIYDPKTHTAYIGTEGSSHGALMQAVPELHKELEKYDNDTFDRNAEVGYYHYYHPPGRNSSPYHLTGAIMPDDVEEEVNNAMERRIKTSAVEPGNDPEFNGFRSWIFMDGYLYMATANYENHQDLCHKYNIDVQDFEEKPFVIGVLWPMGLEWGAEVGDIQFYSDYLQELSEDQAEESDGEYEDLNERNRTDGQLATRALTAIYDWVQDNLPQVKLTVNGSPIEEWLPMGTVKETAVGVPTEFRD